MSENRELETLKKYVQARIAQLDKDLDSRLLFTLSDAYSEILGQIECLTEFNSLDISLAFNVEDRWTTSLSGKLIRKI